MSAELHVISAEPVSTDAVKLLERWLIEAKQGQISSLAIAGVNRSGEVNNEWSKAPSLALLIGSVARLSHRMCIQLGE